VDKGKVRASKEGDRNIKRKRKEKERGRRRSEEERDTQASQVIFLPSLSTKDKS
jgi:hypothetical protein